MRIKITENQYKRIFLSGKFDNILLEQGAVKVLDAFLGDIGTVTRYTGTRAARNFATDFTDDVIKGIEREFGAIEGTINSFDNFKKVLQGHSGPITVNQFKSLLKIRNVVIKDALLSALSKDDNILRILSLFKKAEEKGRNDITQSLRERIKIYLDTEDEVSNFINKYKVSITSKIEDLSYSLDDELFKMFKSIQTEEEFLKLKNEATSLLRNIDSIGFKLYKDTKQYSDFLKAKELLKIITGEKEEFLKFQQFIEKNKIDIDMLKNEIKRKDPSSFSKLLAISDSIWAKSKSIAYLFISILVILLLTGLGIGGYALYNLFKGGDSSSGGDENAKIIKKSIKDNNLSIKINDNITPLTSDDLKQNNSLIDDSGMSFSVLEKDETDKNKVTLKISPFYFNGIKVNDIKVKFDKEVPNALVFISSSGELKSNTQIDEDSNGRQGWLTTNYWVRPDIRIDSSKGIGWSKENKPTTTKDYWDFEKVKINNKDYWHLIIKSDIPNYNVKPGAQTNVYLGYNGLNWYDASTEYYENSIGGFRKFLLNKFGLDYNRVKDKINISGSNGIYTYSLDDVSGSMPKQGTYKFKENYLNKDFGGDNAPIIDTFVES